MPTITQWFPTSDFYPSRNGWYEVRHTPCSFTNDHGYAHWDGKEWRRNYGWPSEGNKKVWTLVNGVLQLPVTSERPPISGHDYALRCSSVVTVLQFRGFTQE